MPAFVPDAKTQPFVWDASKWKSGVEPTSGKASGMPAVTAETTSPVLSDRESELDTSYVAATPTPVIMPRAQAATPRIFTFICHSSVVFV